LKNLLALSSWQHLYEPTNGQNQSVWIAFLQIVTSQEVRTDHFETITPGLVGTEHQAGRFREPALTGRNTEALELVYFRLFKSQSGRNRC